MFNRWYSLFLQSYNYNYTVDLFNQVFIRFEALCQVCIMANLSLNNVVIEVEITF